MKFKVGYFVFLVYYEYTQCHKQFKKIVKGIPWTCLPNGKKNFPVVITNISERYVFVLDNFYKDDVSWRN